MYSVTKYFSVSVPVLSPCSLLKFIAKIPNDCDNKNGETGMVWRETQFCRKIHGFSTLKNIFNSSTGVKAISCYTTSLVRDYSKLLFRVVETLTAVKWNFHLIGWGLKSLWLEIWNYSLVGHSVKLLLIRNMKSWSPETVVCWEWTFSISLGKLWNSHWLEIWNYDLYI